MLHCSIYDLEAPVKVWDLLRALHVDSAVHKGPWGSIKALATLLGHGGHKKAACSSRRH